MKDKIVKLADRSNSATLWSPKDALEDALSTIESEVPNAFTEGNKILIIALDDSNEQYKITWIQAGMKHSECMALCEIAKSEFKSSMNY